MASSRISPTDTSFSGSGRGTLSVRELPVVGESHLSRSGSRGSASVRSGRPRRRTGSGGPVPRGLPPASAGSSIHQIAPARKRWTASAQSWSRSPASAAMSMAPQREGPETGGCRSRHANRCRGSRCRRTRTGAAPRPCSGHRAGRKRSVVRVRNALMRETSARPMASSSAISTNPDALHVQRRVLRPELGQLVGEPFLNRRAP